MINKLLKNIAPHLPENNRLERIWKLAQVDFKKRYYNDKLGLLWALLNPLFQISIYYFIFKEVFKIKIENYGLFLFAGLLIWMAFTEICNKGMNIIKTKRYLIENIQFNKLDLFYSQVIASLIGFTFNFVAFTVLCYSLGVFYSTNFYLFPIIIINLILISLGVGMILSTIQIYLKDIVHAWSIMVLFGFWTSGVFFRGELFLEKWPAMLYIHPFIGIIMNMRAITMQIGDWNSTLMVVDLIWGFGLFLIGKYVFTKYSHKGIELI